MLDAVIWSVFVALILLGTVAICYIIMLKLLMSKSNEDYYIVLPCNEKSTDIRKKAYGIRLKNHIMGEGKWCNVVILDYGISDYEKEQLNLICKECNGIYLIDKDYIKEFLNGRI